MNKFDDILFRGEAIEQNYVGVGTHIKISGQEYLIAHVDARSVNMFNVKTGNFWVRENLEVFDLSAFSRREFVNLIGEGILNSVEVEVV